MIKRSFIGLAKPLIEYEVLDIAPPEPREIPISTRATLFLNRSYDPKESTLFNIGEKVKTGQKISPAENKDAYVISSVTGTISTISSFYGEYGKSYTAISIDVDENEEIDDQFNTVAENPTLDTAANYLSGVPGNPSFDIFFDSEKPIHTIIICGVDSDLLVTTNQYTVKTDLYAIEKGIRILRQITGVDHIFIAVPENLMQDAVVSGAEVRIVDANYPSALPHLMVQSILGQVVPAGKTCEDIGVSFFHAEAVASIGKAFDEGKIPALKRLTFIDKNGEKTLVQARIGTPVSEVINAFDVDLNEKDRIIFGGPMTGSSIYSVDLPVQADTDAIIVQDKDRIDLVSDYPCINCGECVRACPANIPINMLVRFLEAGQYEDAADQYDLYSCIECGLCSFVCVSKMPIFHYIKLAKYELDRIRTVEAMNAQ